MLVNIRANNIIGSFVASALVLAGATASAAETGLTFANLTRQPLKIWSSPLLAETTVPDVRKAGCGFDALGPLNSALPFGVGERAAYKLTLWGLPVGKLETKVGKPRVVDGRRVVPLMACAKTTSLLAAFQPVSGQYMTVMDANSFDPVRVRMTGTYGKDARWEKATFGDDAKEVNTAFRIKGFEGSRRYAADASMQDVLSMIFAARARALEPGATACAEVYAGRRVWRMDVKVRGVEKHNDLDRRRGVIAVEAHFERMAHPHFDPARPAPWIDLEVFLSNDGSQRPLAFNLENGLVKAGGVLTSWTPGRSWS